MKSVSMLMILILVSAQDNHAQSVSAAPSANSFTYPQSVFVDSPNGHVWVTDFDNHRVLRFDVSALTAIEHQRLVTPKEYFLSQNFPNPFNPSTRISFTVGVTGPATLTVHNLLGQHVATVFNEIAVAQTHYSFLFNAKHLPSGIYFYTLRSTNVHEVKRMCLIK